MYQDLITNSVMLIGEKYQSTLVWIQVYETSQSMKETDLRYLLRDIKTHIMKQKIKSGSALKFKEGKLAYYETLGSSSREKSTKVYCLYSLEKKIGVLVKRALQSIADRGGGYSVYSANRFFSEMMDLVLNPKTLQSKLELIEQDVLVRVEFFYQEAYDVNELGQIISFLTKSDKLDFEILEKIYVHVYESLQTLLDGSHQDPDEFLDAAYIVARNYEELGNYPMSLELFKYITIIASMNQRFDLETDCKIRISIIYKNHFPPEGQFIIETLSTVAETHLLESSKPIKEIYYALLGHANAIDGNHQTATSNYQKAIDIAGVNISSPLWIAEAYNYLGEQVSNQYLYAEAIRLYLMSATIAFTEGDITKADNYRDNAARSEIAISDIHIKSALGLRMEHNENDAEYRAWISFRYLIKAFIRATFQSRINFVQKSYVILKEAEAILSIPGKTRKTRAVINKITKFIKELEVQRTTSDKLDKHLAELEKIIEDNIIAPPPTFMLVTSDGQLVIMGKIEDGKWQESEIKGVILGGILVAIMSLIKEVTGKTSLRTIDAGNFRIMMERSESTIVALLLDRDIPEYREKLQNALNFIENNYSKQLDNWSGKISLFNSLKEHLIQMFSSSQDRSSIDQ